MRKDANVKRALPVSLLLWVLPIVFASFGTLGALENQDMPQRWVVEADYGAPLLEGATVGYLINPRWETSLGLTFGQAATALSPPNPFGAPLEPVYLKYFRLSAQGRYNLTQRKSLSGNCLQPYVNFGFDLTSGTQTSNYAFDEIGDISEQDLQLGLGAEYFFLPNFGVGLTLDYIYILAYNAEAPAVKRVALYTPYFPGDSPTISPQFPVVPNFYAQFRF